MSYRFFFQKKSLCRITDIIIVICPNITENWQMLSHSNVNYTIGTTFQRFRFKNKKCTISSTILNNLYASNLYAWYTVKHH